MNGKPTAVGGPLVEQRMELDSGNDAAKSIGLRFEALLALAYFALYLGHMFIRPESDWLHWLSLVLIPFALLSLWHVQVLRVPFRDNLAAFGLRRGNLTSGLLWAVVLGLAISALQLLMSRQADAFLELIRSGRTYSGNLVCVYPEQPDILRCPTLIYQRLTGNDVDKVLWFMSRPRNRPDRKGVSAK
ncbi:MAG TPA: hypothetical protein VLE70_09840 [Anaerolineae bacterium]|nr:hypothetical protein [Anaerolineae bacterium]